jgi:phage tail sheath gpL-like
MTIRNTFPSDKRRPGISAEFDLLSSSRSLVATARRVALIGCKRSTGLATTELPVQIFTEADADREAGIGAELALMARAALRTFVDMGVSAELWLVPVVEPGAGTAANNGTFVCTGSSTSAGEIRFSIAGVVLSAPIANGASVTAQGDAMVAAANARLSELPGTIANAAGTVTYTHRHKGVGGNDVKLRVISSPTGTSIAPTQPSNGASAYDVTASLTALINSGRQYNAVAIANHTSTDVTDLDAFLDDVWGAQKKQWSHAHIGETGSVSTCTSLAANANDYRTCVHAYPSAQALPGVIAASVAAMVEAREAPNFNHDMTRLSAVPPCNPDDVILDSEAETLLAGGCSPLSLDEQGYTRIERVVTTKVLEGSAPNFVLLDLAHSKTVAYTGTQANARLAIIMKGRNVDAALVRDVRGGIYDVLKALEVLGYLHNVDAHAAEIKVEPDPNVVGRLVCEVPSSVVPLAHQAHIVLRLFVEVPAAA